MTCFCQWFQDSVINPITKILVGVAAMTILIVFVVRESPQWAQKFNFSGGSIPPWILALVVIVFTRLSKRTKNFLTKRGWWKVQRLESRSSLKFWLDENFTWYVTHNILSSYPEMLGIFHTIVLNSFPRSFVIIRATDADNLIYQYLPILNLNMVNLFIL